MRVLPLAAAAAALVLPLLSGCLTTAPSDDGPGQATPGPQVTEVAFAGQCSAAMLFQLIDYIETDQYLPPGFHPRDPQELLNIFPVATGQAGVMFLAIDCAEGGAPMAFASVGIFVEPPFVDGVEPGLYDFYEVDRYGSADPFRPALRQADWPELEAEVLLELTVPDAGGRASVVTATVNDEAGSLAAFHGVTQLNIPAGEGAVRFWRDGPDGLGMLEINSTLSSRVGGGTCNVRAGSPLAGFVGGTRCTPPGEPIIVLFPELVVESRATFLPGVHPE